MRIQSISSSKNNIFSTVSFTRDRIKNKDKGKCKDLNMYAYMKEITLLPSKNSNNGDLNTSEHNHFTVASPVVVVFPLTSKELKRENRKIKKLQSMNFLV